MINEEWRDVPGFEERYQISSKGRVKRKERIVKERILEPYKNPAGYKIVGLYGKDGRRRGTPVLCLVKEVFGLKLKNFDAHRWIGKLTEDNIKFIKENRSQYTLRELGEMFNVSHEAIRLAEKRERT